MTLKLQLEVTRQCNELFFFIGEINRLSETKANFILGYKGGSKLYIESCKGLQKSAYASVVNKERLSHVVTIVNYAISQMADIHVSLENTRTLFFEISGESVERIFNFANNVAMDLLITIE